LPFLGFALTSSAQQGATKTTKAAKTETKTVLKKDGTPDKRYKQDKKPTTVLKKDGTPDKRYKASK
jgi:hypothetical protein